MIDDILKNVQFEHEDDEPLTGLPPLIGEQPTKKATHFINKDEKILSAVSTKKGTMNARLQFLLGNEFVNIFSKY